ncbi:MAG: phenylalanine--tRNA ligase subunit beta [Mucinivorans sp.]
MKISYNWLKDYFPTDMPADEASKILTDIGLEVEALEKAEAIRGSLEGLIVAQVITCEKHPDADKLSVTTLNIGSSEPLQVVCGAPNVAAGQKIILATIGATLYPIDSEEGFKIKKSKIRGIESMGMICAEDEIGVGHSHDGIIVLPQDTPIGIPAIEIFDLKGDYLMEIGLTPNRVDASSHYGVARDLAAYLFTKGGTSRATLPNVGPIKICQQPFQVTVHAPKATPRYMGVVMKDIKIEPSPEWIQSRLRAVGINPKNNVVDITNFILYECGQPLHAFDLQKIEGGQINVQFCAEGTPFKTLDGVERKLSKRDLMICNGYGEPMCMAGVFGGEDSGVSDSTTSVFIESAYFDPATVRGASKRHGLSTDSSFRYERGIDPNMASWALARCVSLMEQYAGAHVASAVVDNYPEKINPFVFEINLQRINRLLGKNISQKEVLTIFDGLDIKVVSCHNEDLVVSVPAFRVDVQREADIAEEILRLYGFNNIENPHIIKNVITLGNQHTTDDLVRTVGQLLSANCLNEIMSNSLTKATYYQDLVQYPLDKAVKIINPLSSDLNVMRQTLLFNALEAVELNVNRRRSDLALFEFGKCYSYDAQAGEGLKPYSEHSSLGITMTGSKSQASWNQSSKPTDLYDLKAIVEKVLERVGVNINEGSWTTVSNELYSLAADYTIRGGKLFTIGVVSKKVRALMDIKAEVYFCEMNIEKLQKLKNTVRVQVAELPKYQNVKRDLALLVDKSVTFEQLRMAASKAEKKLLRGVSLFDVYDGDKLPEGKKSYALSFVLEDASKTLSENDIQNAMNNIASALLTSTGAVVRS